uniref:Bifunctional polynucleotide phosphatase/kinase (inferred by orthology to a human protein) n=1 Tax=Strongyloides venezuelensis TaxID=75913 RepID=A0A0K0F9Y0_STRVS
MPKRKLSPQKQVDVLTSKKKVFSIFEKKMPLQKTGTWYCDDKIWVFTHFSVKAKEKVASFDLDHTLIRPTNRATHPRHDLDWEFCFDNVIDELKKLYDNGYKLILFTNQKGISSKKNTNINLKNRIENIVEKINLPLQVFISTGHPKYRKPSKGMWELLCEMYNDSIPINLSNSFYVGDGAGRLGEPILPKRDFSDSDRLFSLNIGITFKTPEEFFKKTKYTGGYFDALFNPKIFFDRTLPLLVPENSEIISSEPEIVLLVGITGSGKSFFASKYLDVNNYYIINDSKKLKSNIFQNPLNVIEGFLNDGKNIVIDERNLEKSTRKFWIDIAKELKVNIRCFYFDLYVYHCCHNMAYKQIVNECKYDPSTKSLVKSSQKILQPPTYEEGFKEIVKVNFLPHFENKEYANIYKSFLPL